VLVNPTAVARQKHRSRNAAIALVFFIIIEVILLVFLVAHKVVAPSTVTTTTVTKPKVSLTGTPKIITSSVLAGRSYVWDVDFLPNKQMIFTERGGALNIVKDKKVVLLAQVPDVVSNGQGGLMGLAVDPKFTANRYIYTCLNSTAGDIRVARWVLAPDFSVTQVRKDIVTGIPSNASGRHSGCQLVFGPDGYLWIGTGDSAQDLKLQTAQDTASLGGKILRVDRNGGPAPGNYSTPFDPRVYSFGHRNVQGIAFFDKERNGISGISADQGTGVDDELNPLKPGNLGWAPPSGPYTETNVPMTDKEKYPSAINALWSSGSEAGTPSGIAVLKGDKWKSWNGGVAMSMLNGKQLNIVFLDDGLDVTKTEKLLVGDNGFGALRAATMGPDGNLYVSTSHGTDDQILKLSPQ
jgi:glucose/arabinose dehydrogenase